MILGFSHHASVVRGFPHWILETSVSTGTYLQKTTTIEINEKHKLQNRNKGNLLEFITS